MTLAAGMVGARMIGYYALNALRFACIVLADLHA